MNKKKMNTTRDSPMRIFPALPETDSSTSLYVSAVKFIDVDKIVLIFLDYLGALMHIN